jgi:hypothetical protein
MHIGSIRSSRLTRCLCLLALLSFGSADAFQVLPKVSDVDRKMTKYGGWLDWLSQYGVDAAAPLLKNPVHEAITLAALGCDNQPGDEMDCVRRADVIEHRMTLYGVRWPDDPPFRLDPKSPPKIISCKPKVTVRSTAQPTCWLGLFNDAGKRAHAHKGASPAFGPGDMILYRSHYGDLQFFHSMASYDGEPAAETRVKMHMWAKFLWAAATKKIRMDVPLRETGVEGLERFFPGDMTATNLFATGIVEARSHLDEVALGALLHMIQDSFSEAHALRLESSGGRCAGLTQYESPGRISEFHSYARQVSSLHDKEDTPAALALQTLQTSPSVVGVTRDIINLWQRHAEWTEAESYFNCVFDLADPKALAGPGRYTTGI